MAANSTTVTAPGTISPKVFWPLLVGVALTFVSAFLAGLTPDMLTALGPMAVPMAFALGAVSQTITAYMKSDELRDLGVQATAAILPIYDQVTPTPTPVFPAPLVAEAPQLDEIEALAEEDLPAGPAAHRATLAEEVAQVRRTGSTAGGVS